MTDLYTTLLGTLGVAPGQALYIVDTDEDQDESLRNTWAIIASSVDDAEATFRQYAKEEAQDWHTATIYQLSPGRHPKMLEWWTVSPRHITKD